MVDTQYVYTTTSYIGETSRGVPNGVFFDPHTQIANNKPPVTFISGTPGTGKTNLAATLACQSAIMDKTTIVVDWKGDFLALKNLEDQIGPVRVWALGDGGTPGSLDPFNMNDDPKEQVQIAMDVIGMFLGGISNQDVRWLSPIVNDVVADRSKAPSLMRVVQALRQSEHAEARAIGAQLHLMSQMSHATICFQPATNKKKTVIVDGGTTVATLFGLDLPTTQEEALKDNSSRLASGIFYLLTYFIRNVMKNTTSDRPKTLIIDEAWAILATEAGARITKEVSLLGRSKKLALILATQNYDHIAGKSLDNTIGTHFAFAASSTAARDVVRGLELSETEGFDSLVSDLSVGECLMRDFSQTPRRYSTVSIEQWRPDWKEALNTNPYTMGK